MGLRYVSGESAALMGALSANLASVKSALEATESACERLKAALGGGKLSGKSYSAARKMFAEAIVPEVAQIKGKIDYAQSSLATYRQADGLVSRYGVLDEDRLREQLRSVKAQRDATERLIEKNRVAVAATSALPGVSSSLEVANTRLEVVLFGLEDDIRELEDKLKALAAFSSQTSGLFDARLDEVVEFLGGYPAIGGYVLGAGRGKINVMRVRDFQGGMRFREDARGRVRWQGSGKNSRYVYDRYGSKMSGGRSNHLYKNGTNFNKATGQMIDAYRQPIKAAGKGFAGAAADTVRDYSGWKSASTLTKFAKGAGIAGTFLTIGSNAYNTFHDGVKSGTQVRDFAIDTAVDLGSGAAAAGIGAAFGSIFLPPLGTVVGALGGLFANFLMNTKFIGNKSVVDLAKDGIKKGWDKVASLFW